MFEKLKELEATLKNFRKGELNTNDTPVTSIVCPKYFSKEEYIELIE